MLKNFLKMTFRNLVRHKLSTFINISGLSIGTACCILIMLYVMNETSYDSFHANADRIYRVLTTQKEVDGRVNKSAYQPMPLVPALKEEFPEILHAARFTTGGVIISRGDRAFEETALFTDPDVFRMFDFSFREGSPETALNNPNEIILSERMAEKYFGNEPALGKTIRMRSRSAQDELIVTGVARAMPVNSSIQFDFLANLKKYTMYERAKDRWTSSNGSAYVLLPPEESREEFEQKLPAFVQKYYGETIQRWQSAGNLSKDEDAWSISLQPLVDVHLDRSVGVSPEKRGNVTYSYILAAIAALVLAIACINFVTLSIGRSANRAKEVGMRKVLGAARMQLIHQFWGEAFILCALSLIAGLALAELLLPAFSTLADRALTINLADGTLLAGLVGLLIILGIAAGSYPALYLSRFEPVETLKGRFKIGGKGLFTRVLIVFQFGLSIFLVCGALILNDQLHFLITKNLGFKPEQVVVLPTYSQKPDDALTIAQRFRTFAASTSDMLDVAVTSGAFTHGYDINGFQVGGQNKVSFVYRIDEHYLSTLGIPLKEGRNFRERSADDIETGMIVNEAFLRMMDWPEPAVGSTIIGSDSKMVEHRKVIGVVPDFHFTSLRQEIRPVMMFMNPDWPLDDVLIRISGGNIPATMQRIRSFWKDIAPGLPFNATFLDEDFRKEYESEMKWGQIVSSSSLLAVALACLGLFGLVTLTVTNRIKEIGIRKVLGASGPGVVRLISADFLKLILLGNILAWPAAYLAASRYLENYAYHIDLDPVMFLFAGAIAAASSFAVILGQILKAMRANPVEALRYE